MTILEIDDLRLRLPRTARPVLAGVNLTVAAGETVTLVGESGSGKTLTARSALGLLPPRAEAGGSVRVAGDDVLTLGPKRLRRLRSEAAAMVFQDPRAAINPLRRIEDFLTEGLRLGLGRSRQAARSRAVELLNAVGLADGTLRQYPHELSGGMLQRVMIAAALMGDPVLLLADEPTTALDVTTQAEIVALLADLQDRYRMGMLFVTHDLGLAAAIGDRMYVMYAGRIVETGPADLLFSTPRHPYTAALLDSVPRPFEARPDQARAEMARADGGERSRRDVSESLESMEGLGFRMPAIAGQPPDLSTALPGCPFAPRCGHASARCEVETPAPMPVPGRPSQVVACHHSDRLAMEGGLRPC